MGQTLGLKSQLKVLWFIFDKHLTFEPQVNSVCRAADFHLGKLYAAKTFTQLEPRKVFARSFILSSLDYGNSLYANREVIVKASANPKHDCARRVWCFSDVSNLSLHERSTLATDETERIHKVFWLMFCVFYGD